VTFIDHFAATGGRHSGPVPVAAAGGLPIAFGRAVGSLREGGLGLQLPWRQRPGSAWQTGIWVASASVGMVAL